MRWHALALKSQTLVGSRAGPPDKTPNAAPAGRAGSCSARRTASRRLQVTPAEPFFGRGKRRAACPLARECVLRVNLYSVGRTRTYLLPVQSRRNFNARSRATYA